MTFKTRLEMDDAAGEIFGFFPDTLYKKQVAESVAARFNESRSTSPDEFAPTMVAMSQQPGVNELTDLIGIYSAVIVTAFTFVMSIVLWNAGLVATLRRYGEIGVRLAFGEDKGRVYRAMIVGVAADWPHRLGCGHGAGDGARPLAADEGLGLQLLDAERDDHDEPRPPR